MSEVEVVARFPVTLLFSGLRTGSVVLGVLALAAVSSASGRPVAAVVQAVFFAVLFGLFTWLLGRRQQRRLFADLPHVRTDGHEGSRAAFIRGLLTALALTVVETVVMAFFAWLFSPEQVQWLLPGILLGLTFQVSLQLRDLRAWEHRNDLVVFTRSGALPIALTSRRAATKLVVVAAGSAHL